MSDPPEIRPPTEGERADVATVLRVSLNFGRAFVEERSKVLPLEDMRCAFVGGRLVATSGERRFTQRFGGRELAMSGIWGVATLPEHRGSGLASAAVMTLLREARDRGDPLTALYPATLRPYRGLGYEVAGSYVTYEVALDDLPPGTAPLAIEPCDPERDLEGIRACYREAVAAHNGPIDSEHPWWWKDRILGHWDPDQIHEVVVVRGERGIEGYMSFVHEPAPGALDIEFDLTCKHLVASTPDGYRTLLAHARRFRGVGHGVKFVGAPDEPATLLIDEQRLKPASTFRWMFRLLDVASALEGRGYRDVSGEATIAVVDERFPENRGPWRIVATDGKVEVTDAASASAGSPISIGALSAMYTGYLSPFDAVRVGLMDRDDPAVPVLARLFAGPSPFMLDFF